MKHYHPKDYIMPEYLKEYLQKNTEYMSQNAESKMEQCYRIL